MAWLYLPESVGLNSELISSSQSQEPFVLSRGKPITLKSYKTKLKRNNWKKPKYTEPAIAWADQEEIDGDHSRVIKYDPSSAGPSNLLC